MSKYASFLDAQMQRELALRDEEYRISAEAMRAEADRFDTCALEAQQADLNECMERLDRYETAMEALADIQLCLEVKAANRERPSHFEAQMVHLTCLQAGMSSLSPSVEAIDGAYPMELNASIENISEHLKKAWEWIKEMVRKIVDFVKSFFASKKIDKIADDAKAADEEIQKTDVSTLSEASLTKIAHAIAPFAIASEWHGYSAEKSAKATDVTISSLTNLVGNAVHVYQDASATPEKLDEVVSKSLIGWKKSGSGWGAPVSSLGGIRVKGYGPWQYEVHRDNGAADYDTKYFVKECISKPSSMVNMIRDIARTLRNSDLPGLKQCMSIASRTAETVERDVPIDDSRVREITDDLESKGIDAEESLRRARGSVKFLQTAMTTMTHCLATIGRNMATLRKALDEVKADRKKGHGADAE